MIRAWAPPLPSGEGLENDVVDYQRRANLLLMLAHLPVLSAYDLGVIRSPGAGLGNLLFPISRALIGQARHGGQFIYPTMRQIKIGTFLRGERDKRTYGDVLRGRSAAEWRTWLGARRQRAISEHVFDGTQRAVTVRYAGLGHFFHDIVGQRELIARWLTENISQPFVGEPFDIGIHVRLGDFAIVDPSASREGIQQPMEWYRAAFKEAGRLIGARAPSVVLFTDGEPSTVQRALGVGPVVTDNSNNALMAILRLSQARVLIASRSTFSIWAAYLGGMPAVWDQRFNRERFFASRDALDFAV